MEKFRPSAELKPTPEGSQAAVLELWRRVESEPQLAFVDEVTERFPGCRIALVGGLVRDAIMGLPSKDYDLVVEGIRAQDGQEPVDVLTQFLVSEGLGSADQVESRAYGVVKFTPLGSREQIDIAMPRRERYEPGMRATNAEVETEDMTIEADFSRRDFTINALGLDMATGELIDPFGGLADLHSETLRTVGDPDRRFLEDPSRILRGVRFVAKFGFAIEPATLEAMKRQKDQILATFQATQIKNGVPTLVELTRVSAETIGRELARSIQGDPAATLRLYDQIGLLPLILPEVAKLKEQKQSPNWHSEGDVYAHTMLVLAKLDELSLRPEIESYLPQLPLSLSMAAVCHDLGKPAVAMEEGGKIHFHDHAEHSVRITLALCQRLHYDKKLTKDIVWLVQNHMKMLSFDQMRPEKRKQFAREPLFPALTLLSYADAAASLRPDGSVDTEFVEPALEMLSELKREEAIGKPSIIISGHEIIAIATEIDPAFDPGRHGHLIGRIKAEINDLYDLGEVTLSEDARTLARKLLRAELVHDK